VKSKGKQDLSSEFFFFLFSFERYYDHTNDLKQVTSAMPGKRHSSVRFFRALMSRVG
jgi:hypothetical protein